MADDGGYEEDARRIERDYVPPHIRTQKQLRAHLKEKGFPPSSIDHIAGTEPGDGWLMTEAEAWSVTDPVNPDADSIASGMDRQGGAISQERAQTIARDVEGRAEEARSSAWDSVGPSTQDAGSIRRSMDSSGVPDSAADQIADDVASDVNAARAEAAQRVGDDGMVRDESGRMIGKPSTVEEEVRDDGIYFRNTGTGTEGRAAAFPEGST